MGPHFLARAEFPSEAAGVDRSADPCLVVATLIADAEATAEPWADQEARLVAQFGDLTSDPGVICLLCTIFRHAPDMPGGERERSRITRIRRLNRLAAELSRVTGLIVVDLDRTLTEIGAQALATDYRLGGPAAAAAAGRRLADVILAAGLDGVVSFEALDAAAASLAAEPVAPWAAPEGIALPDLVAPYPVSSMGPRRRGPEGVMLDLRSGRIRVAQAAVILARSIARQGLARTLARALTAARGLWRSRAHRRV